MKQSLFRRNLRLWISRENAQSTVETALLMPFLLLVLCGVLDFGWIFANTYRAEYAAGTGARYAVTNAADMTQTQLTDEVEELVLDNVWSSEENTVTTLTVDERGITVEVKCHIKTLTFVASTLFGRYYDAAGSVTAAY